MLSRISFILLLFCFAGLASAQKVMVIKVDGSINPVSAGYIERAIEEAEEKNATCLVIQLNTPGGLLKSTRVIVTGLLESPVPVVVYVSPSGAHAGSAGVFVTLAAHVAAMAPGTNIGAAHPVDMQGQSDTIMNTKATNDAAAFIHAIAEKKNRNWQWAERAVRESISVSENEALRLNIIDLVAPSLNELLSTIDGRKVQVQNDSITLRTKDIPVETIEMRWAEKLLNTISDPTIAYILLLIGLYGVMFELYNPGAILPGVVGVIGLILAFYSMHTLPLNYAGLALIIFAIILFLLEIKIVSHGMLAIGGVISMFLGSMMLIRNDSFMQFAAISKSVIITAVLITAAFFLFVIGAGLRAQRSRPVTGTEGMIEETGEVLMTLDPVGTILVRGEIWQAESIAGTINKGDKVKVVSMKDLRLKVTHLHT
jgi:membrane-bound serine protease (ClpP class)